MDKVKIYQIGLSDYGRYGFDKLVELSQEFEKIELCGVYDRDFELLQSAEKFARINKLNIDTYQKTEELYSAATKENQHLDVQVMIYDAGSTTNHSEHIYQSMQNDFFHLAERPPSMNRGEHIREKRLSENGEAMWKADFIERESPVVKKALEIIENGSIESIEVFRESSVGIEKALDNTRRIGVKGGDILDKMSNEIYVLDMIERSGEEIEIEIEEAECRYFHPKTPESEKFTDMYSGYTEEIDAQTATGMTKAEFSAGEVHLKLNSSWMGLSEEAMIKSQKLEEKTGHKFFKRDYSEINGKAFMDEECRFFVIYGETALAGDMERNKLFDLETGEEIETDNYLHDQLYRVLEKSAFEAGGKDTEIISEKEIDIFMNGIFDVKDTINYDREYFDELGKAQEKIKSVVVEDGKVLEAEESQKIAG